MKTVEEQIRDKNTKDLASFLFDFFIGFHNESIDGLCDLKPCDQCKNSCVGCIEEWLHSSRNLNMNK